MTLGARTRRAAWVVALASALLLTSSALGAEAGGLGDDAIRERASEIVADPGYQKSLEHDEELERRLRERNAERLMRRISSGPRSAPTGGGADIGGGLGIVLLVVLGAAVLLFVAVEVRRGMARRRATAKTVHADAALHNDGEAEAMPATLARARALAAEGRFEEAIHMLLAGAVDYVAHIASFKVERAMTSREVLRGAALDEGARDAFRELVMAVEVSLFGGMPVDARDFDRCANAFGYLHGRLTA